MHSYNQIINNLISKNITVAIAESCTGGLLSASFTSTPGVSKIFSMGLITYSNKAKKSLLKIPLSKINKHGAVSKEIAFEMVSNLYKISNCKLCISTTGIAGPDGDTKEKSIGLVYIGIKYKKNNYVFKKNFKGKRNKIQEDTVKYIFRSIKKLI